MVGRVEVANLVLKISSLWRSSPCRGQAFGTPRCAAGFKRSKCFKKGGSPTYRFVGLQAQKVCPGMRLGQTSPSITVATLNSPGSIHVSCATIDR